MCVYNLGLKKKIIVILDDYLQLCGSGGGGCGGKDGYGCGGCDCDCYLLYI